MLPSLKNIVLLGGLAAMLGPIAARGEIAYQIPVPTDQILLPAYYFELQAPMAGGIDPTALIGNYFGVADDPDQPFETREKPSNADPELQQGSAQAAVYIPPGGAGVWCWHALASGLNDRSDSFYWQMEGYEPEVFQFPYHMGIDSADKFRAWDGSYDWQWMPVQDASGPGPKCYDLAEGYHSLRLVHQRKGSVLTFSHVQFEFPNLPVGQRSTLTPAFRHVVVCK
jgi:hypothetical protein